MAYIGYNSSFGNIQKVDSITFDSTTTTFPLRVGGTVVSVSNAASIFISVGGVIQEPLVDYLYVGSNIVFLVAPQAGLSFFGIIVGSSVTIGTPSDGTVTNIKIGETISIAKGGTGATTTSAARTNLGLTTVGNAVAVAVDAAAARTAIGALGAGDAIGAATATTPTVKDSTTKVATTAFVDSLRGLLTSTTSGTLVLSDRGCRVPLSAGVTVPSAVFSTNDVITLDNTTAASITITQGAGLTLRTAGGTVTGNFTLAAHGLATMIFRSGTEAVISGNAG
jgi:hypothetical protein